MGFADGPRVDFLATRAPVRTPSPTLVLSHWEGVRSLWPTHPFWAPGLLPTLAFHTSGTAPRGETAWGGCAEPLRIDICFPRRKLLEETSGAILPKLTWHGFCWREARVLRYLLGDGGGWGTWFDVKGRGFWLNWLRIFAELGRCRDRHGGLKAEI